MEKNNGQKEEISPQKKESSLWVVDVQEGVHKNEKMGDTVFHKAENYLSKYYDIRTNVISLETEISERGKNKWVPCNENDLFIELQKNEIKLSMANLLAILKSNYSVDYNPLLEYFKELTSWDETTDYIAQYANYVQLAPEESREQFNYHFKKWLVRAVKCATIDGYFNKQAFVLTDDGKGQNIGKSSWCRFLCPPSLSKYIAEDIGNNDKDSRLLICKNLLINLDELAVLSRKEINQLKAMFSKDQVNDRLPYDRKNSIIQRVASFIGSTNKSTFLQDETGSVRWLCFVVEGIDWNYSKEFSIDDLWAQAYALSQDSSFDETMTPEDIAQNELRNNKFQDLSQEAELLQKMFRVPVNVEVAEFMQATEVIHEINKIFPGFKLNKMMMGRALVGAGYERVKRKGRYGYLLVKHFDL
tara:strand:- start:5432 stop:6679 length:1248 start_codon:yes stop_codon:yes gene_type:complete